MNELAKNSVFGNLMPSYIETLDNIIFWISSYRSIENKYV